MQETMSTSASWDLPNVFINVQRYGNGPGLVQTGQTDYHRDTRGGGQGDYRPLVLSPKSIQEGVDIIYDAFDLAFEARKTVIIHTEAALGQMSEAVIMPDFKPVRPRPDWALCGRPHQITVPKLNAYDVDGDTLSAARRELVLHNAVKEKYQRWESRFVDDAEYVFVSYGIISRPVSGLVKRLREGGKKVGFIRPISLFPFPEKAFADVCADIKGFIAVEGNDFGMMVDDVAMAAKKTFDVNIPVYSLPVSTGVPKIGMIQEFYEQVASGMVNKIY